MENEALGPSRQGGKPEWFLGWLREVFLLPQAKDPVSSQLEIFQDTFEKLLEIEESVKRTLMNMLTNKARITLAREDDKTQITKLLKSQRIPADKTTVQMPWDQLTEVETKIISRAVESLIKGAGFFHEVPEVLECPLFRYLRQILCHKQGRETGHHI